MELPKLEKRSEKKKLICGNEVVENWRRKKKFVAMELPKIGEKKKELWSC